MEELRFLTREQVRRLQTEFGTPLFVYDQSSLERQVAIALGFPAPFGLTVRYAMKACPSAAVLRVLTRAGLHIDASSGFEVHRAMAAGVPAERIML
ncbi:MAG: diaminopimelate decarboxylase, partial [Candidatus Latescibacteria bacterium]|nr:diaminopimelate decarboxylase [Candidatus Latescibacterota bacterium]